MVGGSLSHSIGDEHTRVESPAALVASAHATIDVPEAGKLQVRTKEEVARKEIVISAILAIQNGDNPRIVEQKLLTYVPNDIREEVLASSASGED